MLWIELLAKILREIEFLFKLFLGTFIVVDAILILYFLLRYVLT